MGLPFEPEKESELSKRWKPALERVWKMSEIEAGTRPGLSRKHVLDFRNGIRLIVSKELHETKHDKTLRIHVSASLFTDSQLWKKLARTVKPEDVVATFRNHVERVMASLFGVRNLDFCRVTEGGVLHWFKEVK